MDVDKYDSAVDVEGAACDTVTSVGDIVVEAVLEDEDDGREVVALEVIFGLESF